MYVNRLALNYALMVTNNKTETRLRGIISIFFCFILPNIISVLLFVTIRAQFKTNLLHSNRAYHCSEDNVLL